MKFDIYQEESYPYLNSLGTLTKPSRMKDIEQAIESPIVDPSTNSQSDKESI